MFLIQEHRFTRFFIDDRKMRFCKVLWGLNKDFWVDFVDKVIAQYVGNGNFLIGKTVQDHYRSLLTIVE